MRYRIRVVMNLLIIGGMAVLSNGCSVIGLTIGASADRNMPAYKTVEPFDTASPEQKSRIITATVKPGKEIIVITHQKAIWGKFEGTTGEDDELALSISQSGNTVVIPLKNISEIRIKNNKQGALFGLMVGAAIDLVVGAAIIDAAAEEWRESWSWGQ